MINGYFDYFHKCSLCKVNALYKVDIYKTAYEMTTTMLSIHDRAAILTVDAPTDRNISFKILSIQQYSCESRELASEILDTATQPDTH